MEATKLAGLEPASVFGYFEELCGIPHGSGNTKMISDYLVDFAKKNELKYIQDADTLLASFPEVRMTDKEGRSARIELVRRLEQQDWQMKYLALFCRVVQHRFRRMKFESEQEKLRFYANAYNAGFMLDSERLRRYKGAYFPHLAKQKFRYADVSLWFYENIPSEDSL